MTDDTKHDHHEHHDHVDEPEHREPDDLDDVSGRRGAGRGAARGGRGRRFGRHHVHHLHVHHHGLGPWGGRRGPGGRGPGGRRGERSVEDRIAFLEELQRDLEQDDADVAAKITRLRDAQATAAPAAAGES